MHLEPGSPEAKRLTNDFRELTAGKNSLLSKLPAGAAHDQVKLSLDQLFSKFANEFHPDVVAPKLKSNVSAGVKSAESFAALAASWVGQEITKTLAPITYIVGAAVQGLPPAWLSSFVDFWNGPWRTLIIVGLATIGSVSLTLALPGVGVGVSAAMIAALIGGSGGGAVDFVGEAAARMGTIQLSQDGKIYVPGFGHVEADPATGQPKAPPDLSKDAKEDFDKNARWAKSNFAANGAPVSGHQVTQKALLEGVKGFGESFISSLAGFGGSKAATWAAELLASRIKQEIAKKVVIALAAAAFQASFDLSTHGLSMGWTAGVMAIQNGQDPVEATRVAVIAGYTDPALIGAAIAGLGAASVRANVINPKLEALIKQQSLLNMAKAASDTLIFTFGSAMGLFAKGIAQAVSAGKSIEEAVAAGFEEAKTAINTALAMLAIRWAGNTVGSLQTRGQTGAAAGGPATTGQENQAHPVNLAGAGAVGLREQHPALTKAVHRAAEEATKALQGTQVVSTQDGFAIRKDIGGTTREVSVGYTGDKGRVGVGVLKGSYSANTNLTVGSTSLGLSAGAGRGAHQAGLGGTVDTKGHTDVSASISAVGRSAEVKGTDPSHAGSGPDNSVGATPEGLMRRSSGAAAEHHEKKVKAGDKKAIRGDEKQSEYDGTGVKSENSENNEGVSVETGGEVKQKKKEDDELAANPDSHSGGA